MIYLRELCRGTAAVHFHLYTSAVTRAFGWYAGALMVVHHAWLLLMLICIRKCEAGSIRWVSFTADRACRLIWLINSIETGEIWRHGTLSTLVQVLTCCLFEAKPLPANYTRWDTVALLSTEPIGIDLKWNVNQYTVLTRNSKCRL